jgi:hypothetical protein
VNEQRSRPNVRPGDVWEWHGKAFYFVQPTQRNDNGEVWCALSIDDGKLESVWFGAEWFNGWVRLTF